MPNNEKELGKYLILERNDLELPHIQLIDGPLASCIFQINEVQFAQEENPDGSIDLNINYDLISGDIQNTPKETISKELGDVVIDILERQLNAEVERV